MVRRPVVVWASLMMLVACQETQVVLVPDGHTFFAVLDERGAVVEGGRLTSGQQAIQAGAETFFVTWTFPLDSLVDQHGEVLADGILGEISITDTPPCQRCRAAAVRLPQVLLPGDACRPSTDVAISAIDADGRAVAVGDLPGGLSNVVLSRRGTCDAAPIAVRADTQIEACPLWPRDGPLVPSHRSLQSNGTVFGVSPGFLYAADASERRVGMTPIPHRRIRAVGAMPGGRDFIYAALAPTKADFRHRYFRVSPTLETEELLGVAETVAPRVLSVFPAEPDRLYLVGRVGNVAGIARCEVVDGRLTTCANEPFESSPCLIDDDLVDAIGLPSGAAFALDPTGALFTRAAAGTSWGCEPTLVDASLSTPNGRTLTVSDGVAAAALDDRWFVCVRGEDGVAIVTGTVAASGRIEGAIETAHIEPDGGCAGLGVFPHRPDVMVANLGERSVLFDGAGRVVDSCAGSECVGLGIRPVGVQRSFGPTVNGGHAAITDEVGAVHVRDAAAPFTRVYGSDDPADTATARVVPGIDNSGVVFMGDRAPIVVRRVDDSCDGFEATPVEGPFTFRDPVRGIEQSVDVFPSLEGRAIDVAAGRDGHYFLAGRAPQFLRYIDLRTNAVHHRDIQSDDVELVHPIDERRAFVLTKNAVFVVDETLSPVPVPLVWDDPDTSVVEESLVDDDRFRAMDGVDGIFWLVGGRRIVRVVPDGAGHYRAEAFWSRRLALPDNEFSTFRGVRTFAADRAVLVTTDIIGSGRLIVTALRLGPRGLDCAGSAGDPRALALCPFEGFDLVASNAPDNDDLLTALVGAEDRLTFLFARSAIAYRFAADLVTLPFPAVRNAAQLDGWILVGGNRAFGVVREVQP